LSSTFLGKTMNNQNFFQKVLGPPTTVPVDESTSTPAELLESQLHESGEKMMDMVRGREDEMRQAVGALKNLSDNQVVALLYKVAEGMGVSGAQMDAMVEEQLAVAESLDEGWFEDKWEALKRWGQRLKLGFTRMGVWGIGAIILGFVFVLSNSVPTLIGWGMSSGAFSTLLSAAKAAGAAALVWMRNNKAMTAGLLTWMATIIAAHKKGAV